jgi:hypothetical protein
MKERLVEVYVGRSFGGDSGDWWVADVYVPADLPREQAEEYALGYIHNNLEELDDWIVFTGIYAFWDDSQMEEMWREQEEDLD